MSSRFVLSPTWGVRPPLFRVQHRLSDWPDCVVDPRRCAGPASLPVRLLMQRKGDIMLEALPKRLRCERCGKSKPAPVHLVAGHHRTASYGPAADSAVELVPPPRG
jgi:hypothetical protein